MNGDDHHDVAERLRAEAPRSFGSVAPDPFGDTGSIELDQSRDLAMIYQADESDFPDILEYSYLTSESGERIWQHQILHRMIRRWCDFSPEAALSWMRREVAQESDEDRLVPRSDRERSHDLMQIIAEETVDDRPEWALDLMEEMLFAARRPGSPDG